MSNLHDSRGFKVPTSLVVLDVVDALRAGATVSTTGAVYNEAWDFLHFGRLRAQYGTQCCEAGKVTIPGPTYDYTVIECLHHGTHRQRR